jgi:large subunit ribosomal protein L22
MVKYSFGEIDPKTMARAYGKEIDMSPKHAVEIARTIKGMTVENAQNYLLKVTRLEKAVKFRKYGSVGHRKGKLGPGRFPVKASRMFLKLLQQVAANAELHIDTEPEDLRIIHLATYKGVRVDSWYPRAHGRSSPKRREKVNVEIIVEKIEELEG